MGIRPQFYVLIGIDDATPVDPRRVNLDPEYLEEILYFRELTPDECWKEDNFFNDHHQGELGIPGCTNQLSDKIYNPTLTSEFALGNIIGYVVHQGPHDDNILRAMAAIDEKYLEDGWQRIPLLNPEEHQLRYRHAGYTPRDIECNRFVAGVFESVATISRMNWSRAQHYLKIVGWNIAETDLRYLLVWNWA